MKNPPKVLIPIVIVMVITLIAATVVGAAWYYDQHKDDSHSPFDSPEFSDYDTEETYLACGCGCCSGVNPVEKCLYRSEGDDLEKIKNQDKAEQQNPGCALMGCSFPVLYRYCDNDATNRNINATTNTNTPTIDTSGWQTYTNEKYEYSLQYPANWFIEENNQELLPEQNLREQLAITNFDPATAPGRELANNEQKYTIGILQDASSMTAEEYVTYLKNNTSFSFGTILNEQSIIINGISAYQVKWSSLGEGINSYIPGEKYMFSVTGAGGATDISEMYNSILSTFTFLIDTSEIQASAEEESMTNNTNGQLPPETSASLASFTDSNNAYSFLYPKDWERQDVSDKLTLHNIKHQFISPSIAVPLDDNKSLSKIVNENNGIIIQVRVYDYEPSLWRDEENFSETIADVNAYINYDVGDAYDRQTEIQFKKDGLWFIIWGYYSESMLEQFKITVLDFANSTKVLTPGITNNINQYKDWMMYITHFGDNIIFNYPSYMRRQQDTRIMLIPTDEAPEGVAEEMFFTIYKEPDPTIEDIKEQCEQSVYSQSIPDLFSETPITVDSSEGMYFIEKVGIDNYKHISCIMLPNKTRLLQFDMTSRESTSGPNIDLYTEIRDATSFY